MSLVVNRATARAATALNRVGLSRVNRLAKEVLWRLAGNRVTVVVDDLRISGPAESWSILSQLQAGTLEPFELDLFSKQLKPGGVVLDVGANIGCYSLLAARGVGASGRVYAFEPDPRAMAPLLVEVARSRAYRSRGCSSLAVFARERLGISPPKAQGWLRLERAWRVRLVA